METFKEKLTHTTYPYDLTIIGSGPFGRAIANLAGQRNIPACLGTRDPDEISKKLNGAELRTPVLETKEAISKGKVVVVAVPWESYRALPLDLINSSQVVIDCSNRCTKRGRSTSQAEDLQHLLPPGVFVVKAFNTLSAYSIEKGMSLAQPKEVPLASDDAQAKAVVSELVSRLGLQPSDRGSLRMAGEIEDITHSFFPNWRLPLIVSTSLWLFLLINTILRNSICAAGDFVPWIWSETEELLSHLNKTSDGHALWLLSLCFLPGCIAAYIQLWRGTKYSQFPTWLDKWLRMRKELGLLMLFSASLHACIYLLTYTASKGSIEFPEVDFKNQTVDWSVEVEVAPAASDMSFKKNCYLVAGITGYGFSIILGITSLPSVANSLSWREFRMIQSKLGWLCLLLCFLHCLIEGLPVKNWKFECGLFPTANNVALWIPYVTVGLKIPLILMDRRLTKIREGKDVRGGCC